MSHANFVVAPRLVKHTIIRLKTSDRSNLSRDLRLQAIDQQKLIVILQPPFDLDQVDRIVDLTCKT